MRRLLLALAAGIAWSSAHAQVFGDWLVEVGSHNTLMASTTNDSGGSLFKLCYVDTQNCLWGFTTDTLCGTGSDSVALLNSTSGARSVETRCVELSEGKQAIVFNDYAAMNNVSKSDTYVGIAMALDSGRFKVFRFSMNGSRQATAIVEDGTVKAGARKTTDLEL